MSDNYKLFLEKFRGQLPLGECFDLLERKLVIGGRQARVYFVDGLTDAEKCQILLNFVLDVRPAEISDVHRADDFLEKLFPYIAAETTCDVDTAVKKMYSGLTAMLVEGLDKIIIADTRDYPQRGVEEPSKEKTLRGAKDGFTESFMRNLGLIRRRIRDNRLIFKHFIVGEKSKTDVGVAYMKGACDEALLTRVESALNRIQLDSVSLSDQTIVEQLEKELYRGKGKSRRMMALNPFPKVRYTQRPDIVCAHLTEGKIAVITDNSPTVLLLPVGIFDFTQDIDDYYFPLLTGNYLRLLRILNMLVILFASPLYILITEGHMDAPFDMDFIVPKDPYALSIFWQFVLLEIAVDGLKLASLNTPESLGTSLSVIGALILGDFSIDAGWFIPQTILVMAVVALASFTQPSIELSYGIKFIRVIMLIGAYLGGVPGVIAGAAVSFLIVSTTKTISGSSYLYPLIPFNGHALKKLLLRTSK